MKNHLKIAFAAASVLAFAQPASAATFYCGGDASISGVAQRSTGYLSVATSFGTFYICNVGEAANGISAETCQGWLTMLMAARGMNKPVTFYFDTADSTNSDLTAPYCTAANFAGYSRVPYYIQVNF